MPGDGSGRGYFEGCLTSFSPRAGVIRSPSLVGALLFFPLPPIEKNSMNKRVEPRFKTDTGVTLQLPNQTQPYPARMVDVSGVGFRLLVEQPIAVGETLQINVEDRRLLVTVRHCGPAENGYFVGVERIDKWLPGEAQDEAAVLGRPRLKNDVDPLRVIGLRNQFSKPSAAGVGTDARRRMMLGGVAAVIGLSVLALIWGGMRGSGHTTAPLPVVEKPVAKTEPESIAPAKTDAKKAAAPVPTPVVKPAVASSAPRPVAHAAVPVVTPPAKPAPIAAATPVVKPAVASSAPRPVAHAAVPVVTPPAKPAPIAAATPVVKPAVASSAPQLVAHAVAPAVAPPAKPASVAGPLQVTLHASELSWVEACADGRVVFAKAFNKGEAGQIKFSNVATIRTGNAGGLEITFGSKPAERMGAKGIIQMWKFTPAGREEVPQNSASACAVH